MSTTEDVIRVRVEVGDTSKGLTKAKQEIRSLAPLGRSVAAGIGGALTAAFALVAGAAGVGLVARGIAGLHSEIKDTEVGIASLVSALTGEDITTSLKIARTQVKGLKEDAAKGAGELNHYADGFQKILGPALAAGATMKEIRKLNKQALAAGFAMRGAEGLLLAPMDVVQAMSAGVGERTTPIVNKLLGAIGMTNEAFNKLSKPERFDALGKAFGTMEAGAALMGKSFTAQTATFKDGVKSIIRDATEPIFMVWTQQLAAANSWMEKNRDAMKEMAEVYGPKLAEVWKAAARNPGAVAGAGGAAVAAGGLAKAGAVGAVGTATGLGGLASAGVLAGALAIVAAGFVAVWGALSEFPELWASLASAGAIMTHALGKLMDAFGQLTGSGSVLNRIGKLITVGFVTAVDLFARGIMVVAAGISFLGKGFQQMGMLMDIAANPISKRSVKDRLEDVKQLGRIANYRLAQDLKEAMKPIKLTRVKPSDGEGGDGSGLPSGGSVVNIAKVEVNIKTRTMDDPNRVAIAFDQIIGRVNQFRTQASTAPMGPKAV